MIGCGAEPTPIPPKRPASSLPRPSDAEILARAIDFVFMKVCIPEELKNGEEVLIIQRQSFILEDCGKLSGFDIVPNEKGYLEFHGAIEPKPPTFPCMAARSIMDAHEGDAFQKRDCMNRNIVATMLPAIKTQRRIQFKQQQEITSAIKKGFWPEFYRSFPNAGGYLEMTLPGYSMDGKNACLYMAFHHGGLWGSGWALFVTIKDGQWYVVKPSMAWIS